jgi:hypothetical protein
MLFVNSMAVWHVINCGILSLLVEVREMSCLCIVAKQLIAAIGGPQAESFLQCASPLGFLRKRWSPGNGLPQIAQLHSRQEGTSVPSASQTSG